MTCTLSKETGDRREAMQRHTSPPVPTLKPKKKSEATSHVPTFKSIQVLFLFARKRERGERERKKEKERREREGEREGERGEREREREEDDAALTAL